MIAASSDDDIDDDDDADEYSSSLVLISVHLALLACTNLNRSFFLLHFCSKTLYFHSFLVKLCFAILCLLSLLYSTA
jgi:hypothetical protein